MTVLLDKNTNPNITQIFFTNDSSEYDILYWDMSENNTMVVDTVNFKLGLTAVNCTVSFSSYEAMVPYIDQYNILLKPTNINLNGLRPDPYYDHPKTGNIISHTYTTTDVEKDLLKGK